VEAIRNDSNVFIVQNQEITPARNVMDARAQRCGEERVSTTHPASTRSLRSTRNASRFQSACGSRTLSPTNSSLVRKISGFRHEIYGKWGTKKSTVLSSLVVSTIASSPHATRQNPPPRGSSRGLWPAVCK